MAIDITGTQKERYDKTIRRKEKLAGFLYDIAKSVFTVMVLTDIAIWFTSGFNMDLLLCIIFGCFATFLFAWYANQLFKY